MLEPGVFPAHLLELALEKAHLVSRTRAWRNGRRARLRIWFRKDWRFKSSRAHHFFRAWTWVDCWTRFSGFERSLALVMAGFDGTPLKKWQPTDQSPGRTD